MIRDPNNIIAYGDIYSWQGVSLGAIHYYGEICCGGRTTKVLGALTQEHATYLNKENFRRGFKITRYHPGKLYDGFLERQEAIDAAIGAYKNDFPQARCLLLGQHTYIEPFPVLELDGPADVFDRLNEIAAMSRPLSCEDREPLTEEWEKLLAQTLGLEWIPWM